MRLKLVVILLFCLLTTRAQVFTEITSEVGVGHFFEQDRFMGGGVVFFDANNDGFDDIYLTSGFGADKYYENNHDGTFTDKTEPAGLSNIYGVYTTGAFSGDIDNDGDQDLFVTTWFLTEDINQVGRNLFYENQGNGVFIERGINAGFREESFSIAATMLDYDLDGFLDVYVGNYVVQREQDVL